MWSVVYNLFCHVQTCAVLAGLRTSVVDFVLNRSRIIDERQTDILLHSAIVFIPLLKVALLTVEIQHCNMVIKYPYWIVLYHTTTHYVPTYIRFSTYCPV